MPKYIGFLRAINVLGRRVEMAELRKLPFSRERHRDALAALALLRGSWTLAATFRQSRSRSPSTRKPLGVIHVVRNVHAFDADVPLRDGVIGVRPDRGQAPPFDIDLHAAEGFAGPNLAGRSMSGHVLLLQRSKM